MDQPKSTALLLVEDDLEIAGLYSLVLGHFGYRTTTAGNADEAFACAAAGSFDLAIVDVRLPGMSGIDVAARLRDQWGIPAMFISAIDDKRTVDDAVAVGALGYIVKPVVPQSLPPAIATALARAGELKQSIARSEHLEAALKSSRAIGMAIGATMAQKGFTDEEAFEHIRTLARQQHRKIEEVVTQIIKGLTQQTGED